MPMAVQLGLLLALAALLLAHVWRMEWVPVPLTVAQAERQGPKRPHEGSDDEQLPETDRAPRGISHLLTYAVALTAALRLGALVVLHR
jgi:hypothetical protein